MKEAINDSYTQAFKNRALINNKQGDAMATTSSRERVPPTSRSQQAFSEFGNVYLFTARRLDDRTGLYYYRNRFVEKATGRFLSRDPLGGRGSSRPDDFNIYAYVKNGPVNFVDPSGLTPDEQLWGDFATQLEKVTFPNMDDDSRTIGLYDCAKRLRAAGAQQAVGQIGITLATAPYKAWKLLSGGQILQDAAKAALEKLTEELKKQFEKELQKFLEAWDCVELSLRDEDKCGCDVIVCYNATTLEYRIQIEGLVSNDSRPNKRCCPPLQNYHRVFKG
jgi:RHS repeat-associated protein